MRRRRRSIRMPRWRGNAATPARSQRWEPYRTVLWIPIYIVLGSWSWNLPPFWYKSEQSFQIVTLLIFWEKMLSILFLAKYFLQNIFCLHFTFSKIFFTNATGNGIKNKLRRWIFVRQSRLFPLFLIVLIRIRIWNTNSDPQSCWIRIQFLIEIEPG